MQNRFGLLVADVMPIYMIMPDILITMRFSINCSTVICSPTIDYAILREATSETYGPPGLFSIILICRQQAISGAVYFAFFTFSLYHKNMENIILSSLSDVTFASGREGIDIPFIALVARFLIVCAGTK